MNPLYLVVQGTYAGQTGELSMTEGGRTKGVRLRMLSGPKRGKTVSFHLRHVQEVK